MRLFSNEYFTKNTSPRNSANPPIHANSFTPMNCSQLMDGNRVASGSGGGATGRGAATGGAMGGGSSGGTRTGTGGGFDGSATGGTGASRRERKSRSISSRLK